MQTNPKLWRQGDVLIQETDRIPFSAHARNTAILYRGEASGHCHALREKESARVWFLNPHHYLEVFEGGAEIVHPEHAPIPLPWGFYRIWQQREYVDAAHVPRIVTD
jgi:hypothetical protein